MLTTSALAVVSVLLATGGQLLLRSGMLKVGFIGSQRLRDPFRLALSTLTTREVVVGLTLFGLSAAIWLVVLSRVSLSIAYPFAGLTYVFTSLVARYILKEDIPPLRWIGIVMVVLGIVVIGVSAAERASDAAASNISVSGQG